MMCKLLRNISSSLSDDVHPRSSQHTAQFSNVITLDCARKLHFPRLPVADDSSPTVGVFICIWPLKLRLRENVMPWDIRSSFRLPVLNGICQNFSFMQTNFSCLRQLPDSPASVVSFLSAFHSRFSIHTVFYIPLSLSYCFYSSILPPA